MTLPRALLEGIARAVRDAGGTMQDVDDLVAVWDRLARQTQARADRIRHEARTVRCCCPDGGLLDAKGRCQRCYGSEQHDG